jgi:hypothetical protein
VTHGLVSRGLGNQHGPLPSGLLPEIEVAEEAAMSWRVPRPYSSSKSCSKIASSP